MPAGRRTDGLRAWGLPAPLPDELGISLLARYLRNWGYVDRGGLARQVFGTANRVLHGACTPGLTALGQSLRHRGQSTGHQFLRRHTLVPYLLSSTPLAAARATATRVATVDVRSLHALLHLQAFDSVFVSHLQFCHVCVATERYYYGEPYWHRLHQVTGIAHCPTHGHRLFSSEVPFIATSLEQLAAASTALRTRSSFAKVEPLFGQELEACFTKRVVESLERRQFGTQQQRFLIRRRLLRIGYSTLGQRVAATRVSQDLEEFLRTHACTTNRLGQPDWQLRLFTDLPGEPTPLQYHVFSLFLLERSRAAGYETR